MQRFKDKFALITGGTNGMGFATAQQFINIPTIPFKRFDEPVETANAVLFLASQEASYIHGTELTVDAGISVIR
ncbi:SDR family oxidoreductase [Sphingobacterium gobiense]|uniref:SDR family oxidoreductase n=1 Tax=Sphingobacterium gobiense TaxID=1382456 RepID=UPI001C6117BA|nr:SDR family oxidoreductase [Sphingobacterium gobiense]